MRLRLMVLVLVLMTFDAVAQTVEVGKYTTREEFSKAFVANLRAVPNTKFTLRSSDKAGGTIQAVRLVRNQELASLFILVTQQDANTVLIEATFTRNGGWFGGGDPRDWAKEYAEQLRSFLPDLTESAAAESSDGAGLERTVALRPKEVVPLGITHRRITIDSVEVTGWPKEDVVQKAASDPGATSKVIATLTYSNRDSADWKCEYVVSVLDEAGVEIGTGRRGVSLDEGEVGDTHRVGVTIKTADIPRAAKLRVQVVPQT